jgi:hypothetical protein
MSERLDRLEKIVESNSRVIETWANESVDFRNRMEATTSRIVDSIELLTQSSVSTYSSAKPAKTSTSA